MSLGTFRSTRVLGIRRRHAPSFKNALGTLSQLHEYLRNGLPFRLGLLFVAADAMPAKQTAAANDRAALKDWLDATGTLSVAEHSEPYLKAAGAAGGGGGGGGQCSGPSCASSASAGRAGELSSLLALKRMVTRAFGFIYRKFSKSAALMFMAERAFLLLSRCHAGRRMPRGPGADSEVA